MHDDELKIRLHDYFDELLSPEEESDFQMLLMENRSLAIELGKLKDLKRRLKNLPLSFEPPTRIIDNITEKLLTLEGKQSGPSKRKIPEQIKPKLKKVKNRSNNKTLINILIIIIIVILGGGGGYYFYSMNKSTTPWRMVTVSGKATIANSVQAIDQISENQILQLSDDGESSIYMQDQGIIKIDGKTEIEIIKANKNSNTLNFNYGKLEYIPKPNSGEFNIFVKNFIISSDNSKFTVSSDKLGDYTIGVLSNYLSVQFSGISYRFAHDHKVKIIAEQVIQIPQNINTNKNFINLINEYNFNKETKTLNKIMSSATKSDALTLHFLLSEVDPAQREQVINRLNEIIPLPYGVTESDILILNQKMLDKWWDKIYSEIF